jgi:Na+-translocating ferredoxin:NAD+ oxidoreductase RnfE subunit
MSSHTIGSAMTQVVQCLFLNMKAWIQLQGNVCRLFGGQSSTGAGISLGVLFLLSVFITHIRLSLIRKSRVVLPLALVICATVCLYIVC